MQRADLTTRAIAGFVDLLIVLGLTRLPDVLGFLSASGFILIRDGLFEGRSPGKKLIGLSVSFEEEPKAAGYRESIIRNVPLAAAYILFLIPFAGWIFGFAVLAVEWLAAMGDERGMRIGDMLAKTWVVQPKPEAAGAGRESVPSENPPSETIGKQESIS